ncbi:hypothetical protein, partial [Pseudomonas syringae group genomosp. 7]|uniref:hypothetical protein n=1 Tax=Pseudomonas syringae group genomosp. 7 TaxID=251699 RepID=UPI00376F6EC5
LVLLGVGLGLNLRDIAAAIGTPIPALPIPYGGSLVDNALAALVALLLAALLRPRGTSLLASLGLRLIRALLPVAMLYVGKLIIDSALH